jgi:hypothetical protein
MSRGQRETHGARRARVKAGTHWCVPCGSKPSLWIVRPAAGSSMALAANLMTAAPGRERTAARLQLGQQGPLAAAPSRREERLLCSECGPWPPRAELTRLDSKPSLCPATDAGSNGFARYCGRRISAPCIESAANAKTGAPIREPPSGRSTCRRVAIRQTLGARHAGAHE